MGVQPTHRGRGQGDASIWKVAAIATMSLATPAMAGEADRHDFRDVREALVRQLSPEGRYCRECHQRAKPVTRRVTLPTEIPLPSTALLLGSGIGAIAIAKRWRKA